MAHYEIFDQNNRLVKEVYSKAEAREYILKHGGRVDRVLGGDSWNCTEQVLTKRAYCKRTSVQDRGVTAFYRAEDKTKKFYPGLSQKRTEEELQAFLEKVMAHFPEWKVKIVLTVKPNLCGSSTARMLDKTIRLCGKGCDYWTLLHEIAHLLKWTTPSHGSEWRACFYNLLDRFGGYGDVVSKALIKAFENEPRRRVNKKLTSGADLLGALNKFLGQTA